MRSLHVLTQAPPMPAALLTPGEEKRAEQWLRRFRDLAERDGDLEDIRRELKEALTKSVVSTRVADGPGVWSKNGWHYELLPDAGTRIAAARLLMAYLAGLPPSQQDIHVHRDPEDHGARRANVPVMLEELESIGIGIADLVQDIRRQAVRSAPLDVETGAASR
jgi:hypothetical protein